MDWIYDVQQGRGAWDAFYEDEAEKDDFDPTKDLTMRDIPRDGEYYNLRQVKEWTTPPAEAFAVTRDDGTLILSMRTLWTVRKTVTPSMGANQVMHLDISVECFVPAMVQDIFKDGASFEELTIRHMNPNDKRKVEKAFPEWIIYLLSLSRNVKRLTLIYNGDHKLLQTATYYDDYIPKMRAYHQQEKDRQEIEKKRKLAQIHKDYNNRYGNKNSGPIFNKTYGVFGSDFNGGAGVNENKKQKQSPLWTGKEMSQWGVKSFLKKNEPQPVPDVVDLVSSESSVFEEIELFAAPTKPKNLFQEIEESLTGLKQCYPIQPKQFWASARDVVPRHFKPMGRIEPLVLRVEFIEWELVFTAANNEVLTWDPEGRKAERLSWAVQSTGDAEDDETAGENGEAQDDGDVDDGSDTETEL